MSVVEIFALEWPEPNTRRAPLLITRTAIMVNIMMMRQRQRGETQANFTHIISTKTVGDIVARVIEGRGWGWGGGYVLPFFNDALVTVFEITPSLPSVDETLWPPTKSNVIKISLVTPEKTRQAQNKN